MTNHPSNSLSRAANDLWEAFVKAREAGYIVVVDGLGFIDLVDPATGDRTQVSSGTREG